MSMSTKIDELPDSYLEDISHQSHMQQNMQKLDYQPVNINKQLKIEKESLFVLLKNEINEENVILFILLLIASTEYLDNYLKHLSYYNIFIKSGILLCVFIIIKIFILPRIKL